MNVIDVSVSREFRLVDAQLDQHKLLDQKRPTAVTPKDW